MHGCPAFAVLLMSDAPAIAAANNIFYDTPFS